MLFNNNDLHQMVSNILNKIGCKFNSKLDINDIKIIRFDDECDNRLGYFNCIGDDVYELIINSILKDYELVDILYKVIAHELCHYIQYKVCFEEKFIFYDNDRGVCGYEIHKKSIESILTDNIGHTWFFYKMANQADSVLHMNISSGLSDEDRDKICKISNISNDKLKKLLETFYKEKPIANDNYFIVEKLHKNKSIVESSEETYSINLIIS